MVTILISATFRGAAITRGEALISMWTLKSAALIRGNTVWIFVKILQNFKLFSHERKLNLTRKVGVQ